MEAVASETGFVPRFLPAPGEPRSLGDLRRRAFERFEELGFPTPRNEAWKYTGLQPITGTDWKPAPRGVRILSPLPAGVRARPLTQALLVAEPHLARIAGFADSAFAALNTALFDEAIVLEIEPGAYVAEPITFDFGGESEAEENGAPEAAFPRLLILAGEASQASVVESHGGSGRRFTNAVTEILLCDGAILEHTKLQTESEDALHVHTLAAFLSRSSRFTSHNIAFGGALARTDLTVALAGEGAECDLFGLYAGRGRQHLDNHTVIDHVKPHGTSRELYKGIMDGASRGVFHGKIIVRQDAQKTDAVQTNKNLILSREALVSSTPALEILADDVKCRHGSTTGQLDAAALFYLRSRGIGEADARALLTYAFAADVAERITVPFVRKAVERQLGVLLGGSGKPMSTAVREVPAAYDLAAIRRDFPILATKIYGKPLVYLDNAASAQKPRAVIDAERDVYERCYANIHRGVHWLSVHATDAYDAAREKARAFVNARKAHEIVFVRGTTEAVNLVAQTYGRQHVGPGDEVLITGLEHHSNIVPWQLLAGEKGARLAVTPLTDAGEIDLEDFEKRLSPKTKLVSVAHLSNALGTILPVRKIVELAHARGIPVFVDGAQAVPRMPVDVQSLGCDFYAFSSHKIYGPTGVGVLYGRTELLEAMPPYQGGGDMIRSVTFAETTFNTLPYKFEAGTPNIAGGIAFGAALDYVSAIGLAAIAAHEHDLLAYATAQVSTVPGLRIIGTAREKAGVLSFVLDGVHPHDIGTVLDREGIAIRTGHHCAQPVMDRFGVPATARASFGLYNTRDEVDALVAALHKVIGMFR